MERSTLVEGGRAQSGRGTRTRTEGAGRLSQDGRYPNNWGMAHDTMVHSPARAQTVRPHGKNTERDLRRDHGSVSPYPVAQTLIVSNATAVMVRSTSAVPPTDPMTARSDARRSSCRPTVGVISYFCPSGAFLSDTFVRALDFMQVTRGGACLQGTCRAGAHHW